MVQGNCRISPRSLDLVVAAALRIPFGHAARIVITVRDQRLPLFYRAHTVFTRPILSLSIKICMDSSLRKVSKVFKLGLR